MTDNIFLTQDTNESQLRGNLVIGNRIPKDYFITKGTGESDLTIHAGSYHLALKDAGIEMANIICYSSILPSIAREIKKPKKIVHGCVMETIISSANSEKGNNATAGIIYGFLHSKKDNKKFGGLVCELNGDYTEFDIKRALKDSLYELYENGFDKKYNLLNIDTIIQSFVPQKRYGTALVGICFVNYIYPMLDVLESD